MFENLFFLRRPMFFLRSTYALLYKLMVDSIRASFIYNVHKHVRKHVNAI